MERKRYGSLFITFALMIFALAVTLPLIALEDVTITLSLLLGFYAGSLLLSGVMIMLFASNDEMEMSNTTYIVFLVLGALLGGLLTSFNFLFTGGLALFGLSVAPIYTFIKEF